MKVRTLLSVLLGLLCLCPFYPLAPAKAAPGGCTVITYLPYTINQPGCYTLAANITCTLSAGSAVYVNADDVDLDLDGYTIDNRSAGIGTAANGVYSYGRSNVMVRNGTLRGFCRAVHLSAAGTGSGLVGLRVQDITTTDTRQAGIYVFGSYGAVVEHNTIITTSTVNAADNSPAFGIFLSGSNGWVLDNAVTGTSAKSVSFALAIQCDNAPRAVVERNKISNNVLTSNSTGIYMTSSDDTIVVANRISTQGTGVSFAGSTGKYRENSTIGCTTAYVGGTNAGDNN